MSSNRFPFSPEASAVEAVAQLTERLRAPASLRMIGTSQISIEFQPDLTPAELTTAAAIVDEVVRTGRARTLGLKTVEQTTALMPELAVLFDFLGRTKADVMALSQAERDDLFFDVQLALTRLLSAFVDPTPAAPPT